MIALLYKFTKTHWTIYVIHANILVYKLYFNKTVKNKKVSSLEAEFETY